MSGRRTRLTGLSSPGPRRPTRRPPRSRTPRRRPRPSPDARAASSRVTPRGPDSGARPLPARVSGAPRPGRDPRPRHRSPDGRGAAPSGATRGGPDLDGTGPVGSRVGDRWKGPNGQRTMEDDSRQGPDPRGPSDARPVLRGGARVLPVASGPAASTARTTGVSAGGLGPRRRGDTCPGDRTSPAPDSAAMGVAEEDARGPSSRVTSGPLCP